MGKKKRKIRKEGGVAVTNCGIPWRNVQASVPGDEEFKELDAVLYSDAVLDTAVLETYPDLRRFSKRDQLILAGRALGMGLKAIGEAVGLSAPGVLKVLDRVDPDRKICMTPDAKKAYIARMVEGRAMEAVRAITDEKLAEASAKDLSVIAKNLVSLGGGRKEEGRSVTPGQLDILLAEIIEGGIESEELLLEGEE